MGLWGPQGLGPDPTLRSVPSLPEVRVLALQRVGCGPGKSRRKRAADRGPAGRRLSHSHPLCSGSQTFHHHWLLFVSLPSTKETLRFERCLLNLLIFHFLFYSPKHTTLSTRASKSDKVISVIISITMSIFISSCVPTVFRGPDDLVISYLYFFCNKMLMSSFTF